MRALMPGVLADKIDAAAQQIAGERREVAVLTLSISNLAKVGQQLDSEDAYLLTDQAMNLLASVIYQYEGSLDKYTGDGLIALFGLPLAHENDPERAIRAALDMQTALEPLRARVNERHGFDLQARVGIHTGLVIAGKIGNEHRASYTVIGDTVDLADSLHGAAKVGTILVSSTTFQRTRPLFQYRIQSDILVGSRTIHAFQPLGLQTKPGQVRGVPGLQTPMIGREANLAQLNEALTGVLQERRAGLVLITGEAGVGKSRLVAEFTKNLPLRHISVYQGNCLTYARSKPMWLLADLLRSMIQVAETMPDQTQREALEAYLRSLGLPADDLLPYLVDILGIQQRDEKAEARIRHIEGTVRQKLAQTALRQVLLQQARVTPVVLVLEDLHWVDPASRDLLANLIGTLDEGPLMLILVSRQAERETVVRPSIAAAEQHSVRLVDIPVEPLSEVETKRLVDQLLPRAGEDISPIKARIVQRAEGNPLYAEEIVCMLMDQGGLVRNDDTYRILPLADDLLRTVPGTLRGLIVSRLDRLPEMVRETVRAASVLGPVFPANLLQSLLDSEGREAGADIQELEARQLLACESSASGQNCVFRHALIQEVVYDSLLKRARQRLHNRAARIIKQGAFWPADQQVEALAYHYAQTDDPSRALPYLVAAADKAARRCANETAIQHYRHALALMEGEGTKDTDLHLRAQMGLGQALKFVGEYAAASKALRDALGYLLQPDVLSHASSTVDVWVQGLIELADIQAREGVPGEAIAHLQAGLDLLGEDGVQQHPHLWRLVMDRLALVRFRQGQLDEAYELANAGVFSLDSTDDEDQMTLASLYNTLGGVLWQQGNLAEAAVYVQRSLELYEQMAYPWGMANGYSNLGVLHYRLGNWRQTLGEWQKALEIRRSIGDVPQQALTLSNLGYLRMSMGEHKQAREDFKQSWAIGRRLGDSRIVANSIVSLAHLAVIESRFTEAQEHSEQALTLAESIGSSEVQIQARWLLALAEAETIGVEVGLASARQAWKRIVCARWAACEHVWGSGWRPRPIFTSRLRSACSKKIPTARAWHSWKWAACTTIWRVPGIWPRRAGSLGLWIFWGRRSACSSTSGLPMTGA
jgi:adenylate cyclase